MTKSMDITFVDNPEHVLIHVSRRLHPEGGQWKRNQFHDKPMTGDERVEAIEEASGMSFYAYEDGKLIRVPNPTGGMK